MDKERQMDLHLYRANISSGSRVRRLHGLLIEIVNDGDESDHQME